MATRAVQTVAYYRAWDTSANTPKTGDSANHTLRWVKDGTSSATTNSPSEVDSTNAPGLYKVTLTSTETDCVFGCLTGKSSTSNIYLFGVQIGFEYVPTSSTTYGAFIGNATAALAVDASGRVDVSKLAGQTVTAGAGVTFPSSVASPTNITAGTITTVTNLTNAPTNGDLTAAMKTSVTTAATAATPTAAAVTGNIGGNVVGSIGSLATQAKADVNAEVDTAISDAALATAANLATVDSNLDAVKTVTDQLTFGVTGKVDANVTHVNETEVTGDGQSGTEWGPA